MATYLRPGVFVEETLNPVTGANNDTSDAFAAFVGVSAKGGPTGPVLVNSWQQYQSLFGSFGALSSVADSDLAYAVYSFFNNGGSQCYVTRAVNADAVAASLSLLDADPDGGGPMTAIPLLTVTAKSPGKWASDVDNSDNYLNVTVQPKDGGRFDLTISVGPAGYSTNREQFIDLALWDADPRNAESIINSPTIGSKYVTVQIESSDPNLALAAVGNAPLTGGSDGTGTPDLAAAAATLDEVDNILLVNLPGVSDSDVLSTVIGWAEDAQNRFIVVDVPKPAVGDVASDVAADASALAFGLPVSSYAAVYGPWIHIQDPARASGATRLTAPGGAVLGQYARNDVLRGVQKVPAGTQTTIKAVAAHVKFSSSQLDTLNQQGVNVIRTIPGVGLCIMGGRTLDPSTLGRYVNVRRTLMYLKRSLSSLARFAIFENNDSSTWETIEATLAAFLTAFWQGGGLKGSTTSEAFFVVCDSSNNSASDIAAGNVNVDVGVALESPAEFVVIRIGQYDGVPTVTADSTDVSVY